MCGAGLHDLTDPGNVRTYRRSGGRTMRFCRPCALRRSRERRTRGRTPVPSPSRTGPRPARRSVLGILQALARGETAAEIADRLGMTCDAVEDCLDMQRRRYGARSLAAAVLAGLARGEIRPLGWEHPLPPRNNTTRNHTRSLLRLVRGERTACAAGPAHERMMDDLYAWHEPHAVSVLWAAGIITADDLPARLRAAA